MISTTFIPLENYTLPSQLTRLVATTPNLPEGPLLATKWAKKWGVCKRVQNLNSKNFNKLRMLPLACLLEQENLITFHLFYSISTGCQFVIEFILKSFFSPGKYFMTWHLLTSANLLIFTIHHVNFVLHIKTSSPFLGHSLPMATEPFTHVLLNSGTHFLQIYVFVAHWIFSKRLLRLTYLKLLMTVLRLPLVLLFFM